MNAKNSKNTRLFGWALLPVLALAAQAAGCVVVEEEDNCFEGDLICNGDYVEECYDDEWVVFDDCYYICGGTCEYLSSGEPVCVCEF